MIKNRNLVYKIREFMPENRWIHNKLADWKIQELKNEMISDYYITLGENDTSKISEIVQLFAKKRPKQISKLIKKFNIYLTRANLSYSPEEYQDNKTNMIFNYLAYGFAPDEFIFYRLNNRSLEEKKAYVTDIDRRIMQYQMNDFKDLIYLTDKSGTYKKFRPFYYREEISISDKSDFDKFKQFANKHNHLVIKQVSASCGQGIQIEKTDHDHLQQQFKSILKRGKCSIEERIAQAEIMRQFNESSINTVRVITFNTNHGLKIGPCFFRNGRKGSIVDNGGAGGIFITLDRYTGILDSDGWDEYLNCYVAHPDSGVHYRGFQLPAWDDCLHIVRKMCSLVPRLGYIGWDLAYTPQGWVLVEANAAGQFVMPQICHNCGCKPEIEEYIADRIIW